MRRFARIPPKSWNVMTSNPRRLSFISGAFLGKGHFDEVMPYPARFKNTEEKDTVNELCQKSAQLVKEPIPKLGEQGLFGMMMPFEQGGLGLTHAGMVRVVDALAQHSPQVAAFIRNVQSLGSHAVLLLGTPEQKGKFIQKFVDGGSMATFAYTEVNTIHDNGAMETKATLAANGTGYEIDGTKVNVLHADVATHFIVLAKTETQVAVEGQETASLVNRLSMFIVEKNETVTVKPSTSDPTSSQTFTVTFSKTPVPVENILDIAGNGHGGNLIVQHCAHGTQCAVLLGIMRTLISKLPSPVDPELLAQFYAAESLTYVIAACMDRQVEDHLMEDIAMKVFVTETAQAVAHAYLLTASDSKDARIEEALNILSQNVFRSALDEGQNDVLQLFLSSIGGEDAGITMRDTSTLTLMQRRTLTALGVKDRLPHAVPEQLKESATKLEQQIVTFGAVAERAVMKAGTRFTEHHQTLLTLASIAATLYAQVVSISRAAHAHVTKFENANQEIALAKLFCARASTTAELHMREIAQTWKHIESTNARICNDVLNFEDYVALPPGSQK
eukprot:PhF_6_TR42736/c0_g1_i1/m.64589/K09479/ACADVL; very long chain acyl-CoA dehydrogenase